MDNRNPKPAAIGKSNKRSHRKMKGSNDNVKGDISENIIEAKKPRKSRSDKDAVPVPSANDCDGVSFFDLERFDVYPEIFKHLELRDFLNFSLVSKGTNAIVTPEIICRSKIIIQKKTISEEKQLVLANFQRSYDEVQLERDTNYKTIKMLRYILSLGVFKNFNLQLEIDYFHQNLILLRRLNKIGFEQFSFNYCGGMNGNSLARLQLKPYSEKITKFESPDLTILQTVPDSKIESNIREIKVFITYPKNVDFDQLIELPKLKVLKLPYYYYLSPEYIEPATRMIRSILKKSSNQIERLDLSNFCSIVTIGVVKQILVGNARTLETIELHYDGRKIFNLLPAQPKRLTVTKGRFESSDITLPNEFLRGQLHLEVVSIYSIALNQELLDILVCNRNLWSLEINGCILGSPKNYKHVGEIFSRLRSLSYKGNLPFLKLVAKHLTNLDTLSLDCAFPTGKLGQQPVEIPRLKVLTLKSRGQGTISLFEKGIELPSLECIDITSSSKEPFNINILIKYKHLLKSMKIRSWLNLSQITQLLEFPVLERFVFKCKYQCLSEECAVSALKKLIEFRHKLIYANIFICDWNLRSLGKMLSELSDGFQVVGVIKNKCTVGLEIIFGDPILIYIKSHVQSCWDSDI